MKKKALVLTVLFACFFVLRPAQAHPLDISISELNVRPEISTIEVSTYLHPYEGEYLLTKKHPYTLDKISDFFLHEDLFFAYVQTHLAFKNNGKDCVFQKGDMPQKDEIEIVADGIQLNYGWLCQGTLDKLSFSNTLFIDDFSLQTNKMLFYLNGKYEKTVYEKVLTTKVFTAGFNLNSPPDAGAAKLVDTDGDRLSDYEESLYLTDPAIQDTDFDGYIDEEEVDNGWDPRDPTPSPGQTLRIPVEQARQQQTAYWERKPTQQETTDQERETPVQSASAVPNANATPTVARSSSENAALLDVSGPTQTTGDQRSDTSSSTAGAMNPDKPSGAFFFQNENLKKLLHIIKNLLVSPGLVPKLLVFFPIFLLGFLHPLEGGHGKSVLLSYLVETERTMWDALRFSLTLTLTDLAGVIVLGIGFQLLSLSGSGYHYMNAIQTMGVWFLLGLGVFLLARAIFRYAQPWRTELEGAHRHTVTLGFLSGLVPCTSGWALILTVISLGQVQWMVPVILIFGLGIFFFLVILSALILQFRNVVTKQVPWIIRLSPILSATLILLVAGFALKLMYLR